MSHQLRCPAQVVTQAPDGARTCCMLAPPLPIKPPTELAATWICTVDTALLAPPSPIPVTHPL